MRFGDLTPTKRAQATSRIRSCAHWCATQGRPRISGGLRQAMRHFGSLPIKQSISLRHPFSSAAAEIYALSQTVKDARHARWVANEMGVNTTSCVQVEVDNNQAISFQRGTCPSTKLKGVYDLRWNWVQEIRRDGEVKCVSVNTKHNCADLLTKCLKREDFERLLALCQEPV